MALGAHDGFKSFSNKTLNSYKFCINDFQTTYFDVMESPFNLLINVL